MARGRFGSWDPVMFGLLVANSLFVAGTALLIVVLGTRKLCSYGMSLVASLLYLLNFCIPNLRLAGLVDAGEGFFLLVLLWSLSELNLAVLPVVVVLGASTKESFIPFSFMFMATWWVVVRKTLHSPLQSLIWITTSSVAGLLAVIGLQWSIGGRWVSPLDFAAKLHYHHDYFWPFASSFWDRNSWYIFLWLLPAGIPKLKTFPKSWLIPSAAASVMAFVLDVYYGSHGGASGTVGRALFSIDGPLLALSSASFLLDK